MQRNIFDQFINNGSQRRHFEKKGFILKVFCCFLLYNRHVYAFQKRTTEDFIDPLANKKPRISHLISKGSVPVNGKLANSSNGKDSCGLSSAPLPLLELSQHLEPLSDVSNDSSHNGRDCEGQEQAVAERLSQTSGFTGSSLQTRTQTQAVLGSTTVPPCSLEGSKERSSSPLLHGKSKKSKKHKDKDKSRKKDPEKEKRDRKAAEGGDGLQLTKLYNVPDLSVMSIPHKSTGTDIVQCLENDTFWT